MNISHRGLDEYTLAAFLSGKLSPQRRKEVAAQLAEDEEALSLLIAARDLLESTGDGQELRRSRVPTLSVSGGAPPSDRRMQNVFWGLSILVLMALLVAVSFVAIRVGSEMESREMLAPAGIVDPSWAPRVHAAQAGFSWPADPDAATYALVVWDDRQNRLAFRIVTSSSSIPADHPLSQSLQADGSYHLWVEALDESGGLLRRTRPVNLGVD